MVAVAVVILVTWRYMYRRWSVSVNKFEKLSSDIKGENSQDNYEVGLVYIWLHPHVSLTSALQ